jgi:riboflavin biosynthesis pyrimidine reductase
MQEIRAMQDVIVMGAGTFMAHPKPLLVKHKKLKKLRVNLGFSAEPATAIVSSRLDFVANTPWERSTSIERFVFCGNRYNKAAKARLEANGVKVICGRGPRASAKEMLEYFGTKKFKKLLLEGGGELNASFFAQDLVDRIYLTFCPILIGGQDSPTIFEGQGLVKNQFLKWRLRRCETKGSELYLVYDRKN